ncbi:GNAT family N-acetyltransferase [Halobacillus salinarum]|uniref:GNAT family N-acetyltransferase n=1 Tax=Halobacillus salinarum TaxID=2932257 RepID=A0ABY4EMW2_9BACI|nr:GNAT family N-acetyltransferase [Halobacillus salinarum]UOQ44999.1 GNAT family N-acetyltransferase [Halobacillus salinarum]
MLAFKTLNEVPLKEAAEIWNLCFEGYSMNVSVTTEGLIQRFTADGLSVELSFIAYKDHKPAGIVLNGIREQQGKMRAWNGGTGIPVSYRGKGLGRELIEHALQLYQERDVTTASLEALSDNGRAIKLYEKMGYKKIETLLFLQQEGTLQTAANQQGFQLETSIASQAQYLKFSPKRVPWQCQWPSLRLDGELAVVKKEGEVLAYLLYKRRYDEEGRLKTILLFQTGGEEQHPAYREALEFGLGRIFQPRIHCKRMTFNFPESSCTAVKLLKGRGFETSMRQVYMEKKL